MEFSTNPGHAKVRFASPLQLPDEAMVYRVKTKPVTEERIRELIKLFNMPDPDAVPVEPQALGKGRRTADRLSNRVIITRGGAEGSYIIPNRHESLYVRNDGVITYSSEPPEQVQAPSEKESIAIAEAFLKRSGLIPPNAKLQLIGVGGSGVQAAYDDGTVGPNIMEERAPQFWVVRQDKTLERSTVEVSVCAGGRISGLVLCARDIEPYMSYPIKNQTEVEADLRAGKASIPETIDDRYYKADARVVDVEIESHRLAYIEPIYFERVTYIQPVLYLVGKATTKAGKTGSVVCQVAPIKPEYTIGKKAAKNPRRK
jgi:hypothetical protein